MIHFLPNNTVRERHLQGALEILRDPKRWCKVYFAQKGTLIASMVPSMRLVCLYSKSLQSTYLTNLITSGAILCAVRCKSHFGSSALRWALRKYHRRACCKLEPIAPPREAKSAWKVQLRTYKKGQE